MSYLFATLCALAVTALPFFGGYYLSAGVFDLPNIIFAAVSGLFVLLCFICPISTARLSKKDRKAENNVAKSREKLLAARDKAHKKPAKTKRSMKSKLASSKFLFFMLWVFFAVCAFCAGSLCKISLWFVPLALLVFSGLFGLFCALFKKNKTEFNEQVISRSDYPELYSVLDEAKKLTGVKSDIDICVQDSWNAGICNVNNKYHILLGASLAYLMSRKELTYVFVHELAHVANGDVELGVKLKKFAGKLTGVNKVVGIIADLFVRGIRRRLFKSWDVYARTASLSKERVADLYVKEYCDAQVYVNALAKINTVRFYDDDVNRLELYYNGEKVRDDVATFSTKLYHETLEKNKQRWHDLLMRELPPLLDSHPIFNQRMKYMGVSDFSLDIETDDAPYGEEKTKLLDAADKICSREYSESYDEDRHKNYVRPMERIGFYQQGTERGYKFSSSEKLSVAGAYKQLRCYEEGKKLASEVLESEPHNAYAMYFLGSILLLQEKPEGMELLYEAAKENRNFIGDYIELAGDYCLKNGLEDELARYRERSLELRQEKVDYGEDFGRLTAKDKLVYHDMPAELLDDILGFLKSRGEGYLSKVYLVRKVISEDVFSWVFYLKFKKKADKNIAYSISDALFTNLDYRNEQFSQFSSFDVPKWEKYVKNVKGSLVYKASRKKSK